jgi:hypothetical protein
MSIVFILLGAAGLVLATVTMLLLWFNWNEKIYGQVFTILGIGLATALASIVIGLRETKIESAFVTSVLLDVDDNEPPPVQVTEDYSQLGMRLMDLHRLVPFPFRITDRGAEKIEIQKPTDEDGRQSFCAELLQYYLLQSVQTLQQGRILSLTVAKTSILTSTPLPFRLTKTSDLGHGQLLPIVAGNRFSTGDEQNRWWSLTAFPLPAGTRVDLIHKAAGPNNPEQFIVRFLKAHYFQIDLTTQSVGFSDIGVFPKGVTFYDAHKDKKIRTYHAQVLMSATFDRISASSNETEEYKEWVKWLFDNLQQKFKD